MDIATTIEGTSATMTLTGKLTVAAAPGLEEAFAGLPAEVSDITLDLAKLDYISSAGLRVVVAQDKKVRKGGGSLRLAHPNDEVMEVFDATGLVDILEIER